MFDSEPARSSVAALACCCVIILFAAIAPLIAKIAKTANKPKSSALTFVFFDNFTNAKISSDIILIYKW
jgi:hypothetical protein